MSTGDFMTDHQETFARRLRMLRHARGMTLEQVAAASGGLVTKQAVSKYERGLMLPSPRVATGLAEGLGVRVADLMNPPSIAVEVLAFRRLSCLPAKEQERVEGLVSEMLERRVKLQEASGQQSLGADTALNFQPSSVEVCEQIAGEVRESWSLGTDPISSVTDVLEERHVHVLEIDTARELDGLAAVACDASGVQRAAAVVCRRGLPGERQRLSLAHELGHLVMESAPGVDEEKAAFRFGGAFLAPEELVRRDVGAARRQVSLAELMLLKRRYGMSMQALVYRLRDLGIIAPTQAAALWRQINARGWKKHEPGELEPEHPQWARRAALRAVAEGALTVAEAEYLLGSRLEELRSKETTDRRDLARLTVAERRRRLRLDAARARGEYADDEEWRELLGGDLLPDE